MKNRFGFFLLIVLLTLSFTKGAARSQNAPSQIMYYETNFENLAKSYFLLANLDADKDDNIDQYLMITECMLFKQFYTNDFEWKKIREATRKYIVANKQSFPRHFEFVEPILMDRYDETAKTFTLLPQSRMIGIKKLQISGNQIMTYSCLNADKYNPDVFPPNALLNLGRPYSLTTVHADKATAEEYLKFLSDNHINTRYNRPAYIRFRIKAQQSLGVTKDSTTVLANFYGEIESVSIFGDPQLFIKLDEVKF